MFEIDLHLGRRLRWRRRMIGLTQAGLGTMCGVRFQQIQKYESAANRMSAAMIWRTATALGVGVQYFYEGLGAERSAAALDATGPMNQPAFDPTIDQVSAP
jgi:transcriptional regulator with XRE-family HTH domain